MKNAYIKYTMENRKTTEGIIHCLLFNEQMLIEESKQYGCEIKFGIESFYNG